MLLEAINAPKIIEKLRQAKLLQVEINKTELLLNQAKTALTALGIKPSNLTKLVAQIKASTTPLENTFFKNTAGVLSIVPSVVSASLDTSIREILAPLIPRDITSAGFEVAKKASVVAIGKDVVKYGMKKADYDAIVKRITETAVQLRYYAYSTEGYLLKFGEVEDPYTEFVDTSKIILKFDVLENAQGSLLNDSTLTSEFEDISLEYTGNPLMLSEDGRSFAKFVSPGYGGNDNWFGGDSLKLNSSSRFVDLDESMSIELDLKVAYSTAETRDIDSGYWAANIFEMESSFSLFYQHAGPSYGNQKLLRFGTGIWNFVGVENIIPDNWYKVKIDLWHEGGVYRRHMVVQDLATQQEFVAKDSNSPLLTEIPGKWLRVGSDPGNFYAYGIEFHIDNFKVKTNPTFTKPPIIKFFDPTKTSQGIMLTNSNKNARISQNTFTFLTTSSLESNSRGRKYFEVTNISDNPSSLIVGLIPADMDVASLADFFPGKISGTFGIAANRSLGVVAHVEGSIWNENVVQHIGQGDVVRVAIDFDDSHGNGAEEIFFGLNENWCYYETGRDPLVFNSPKNSYIRPYTQLPKGTPLKICIAMKGTTQEVKLNVGQEPFTYSIPPRYVAWSDIGVI